VDENRVETAKRYKFLWNFRIDCHRIVGTVVNLAMGRAYWQIGYLIVEHEQEGKERAEYGKAVLEELSNCYFGLKATRPENGI
jgi:hypothetical protein